ncbi:sulfotransferase [Marinobacter sp.]|uniref:sulfotransferase n=1 Tax=Marinobacter sp. TaxID=50741 RepID=UPI00356B42A6
MSTRDPLNILVTGIYRSGSSAVVDYLKGHPDVVAPGGEFTEFKSPGRIGDLLSEPSAAKAKRMARRMVWETRLARLPRAWWKERKGGDHPPLKFRVEQNRMKLRALARHRAELARNAPPSGPRHFNNWMKDITATYAGGKRALLLNQPIWIGSHENVWPDVFDPFKLIVVHRDPVDQFADVVRQGTLGKPKTDPLYVGDHHEADPVGYLLEGLTRKYQALHELTARLPGEQVLTMPFETFVLNHDQAAARLCQYLGLEQRQAEELRRFFPEQSRKNIGIGNTAENRKQLEPYEPQLRIIRELRATLGDPVKDNAMTGV